MADDTMTDTADVGALHARIADLESQLQAQPAAQVEAAREQLYGLQAEAAQLQARRVEELLDLHTKRGAIMPSERAFYRRTAHADFEAAKRHLGAKPTLLQPVEWPELPTERDAARSAFRERFGIEKPEGGDD